MHIEERVVLLDQSERPAGTALKREVHTADTALHLAFSSYLFNNLGEVLVTRRALSKRTWPGVWTNSLCGHPAPGEAPHDAIARRAADELGVRVTGIRTALPSFRYRAVDASGIVENEVCPVFLAQVEGELAPCPTEVAQWVWLCPIRLSQAMALTPFAFSPWSVSQVSQLVEHHPELFGDSHAH